jgi:hypothetical protein
LNALLQDLAYVDLVIRAPGKLSDPPGFWIQHDKYFDEYMETLLPFLADRLRPLVASKLAAGCTKEPVISIDTNGDQQAQYIVWKYFKCRHCLVGTLHGDAVFKRKRRERVGPHLQCDVDPSTSHKGNTRKAQEQLGVLDWWYCRCSDCI